MRALILALLLGLVGCASNPVAWVHGQTHRLTMTFQDGGGSCSGTAVGPHAVLTAEHCLEAATSLSVDGKRVAVKKILLDHNDHAIVLVDATFGDYASIAPEPTQGGEIFICGNPADLQDQCRFGHLSGWLVDEFGKWTLYDLNGFPGDSGSGIFDAHGRLVGVISIIVPRMSGPSYLKLMGTLPLAFTAKQWAEAKEMSAEAYDYQNAPIDDDDDD